MGSPGIPRFKVPIVGRCYLPGETWKSIVILRMNRCVTGVDVWKEKFNHFKTINANIMHHVRSRPSHESSRVFSVECFAKSSQNEVAMAAIFSRYIFFDELPNPQELMNSLLESNPWWVSVPLSMLTFYEDIYISELRDSLSKADQYFLVYCNFKHGHALYHTCLYHILCYDIWHMHRIA